MPPLLYSFNYFSVTASLLPAHQKLHSFTYLVSLLDCVMDNKSNQNATPLNHQRELTRARSRQIWANIKPDVFRIYVQQDKGVNDVMAAIEETYGLKVSYVGNFDTEAKEIG